MNVELGSDCIALLHRVVNEVQLSFAAAAAPSPPSLPSASSMSPADSPRSSTSSSSQNSPTSPSRTSSLLYSIFQPLLPTPAPQRQVPAHVAVHMQPARAHRRQARSLLVDAYRRHVLPSIKERLPSAYLLWAIQSESNTKLDEYNGLRSDVNSTLASCGLDISAVHDEQEPCSPLRRYQSASSSPTSYSPISSRSSTPGSSGFSSYDSEISNAEKYLLSIPPAHILPAKQRVAYSAQLTRLNQLASRIGSINKLASRYEREEGKRKWLEQLDLDRDADRALRRAFSNGTLTASKNLSATPGRRSSLCNSTTAADLEQQSRRLACQAAATATAALEDILEATSDEDDVSEPELSDSRSSLSASPEPIPRTPTTDRATAFSDDEDMPLSPSPASAKSFEDAPEWDDGDDEDHDMFSRTPPLYFDGQKRVPLPPLPSQPQWRVQDTY